MGIGLQHIVVRRLYFLLYERTRFRVGIAGGASVDLKGVYVFTWDLSLAHNFSEQPTKKDTGEVTQKCCCILTTQNTEENIHDVEVIYRLDTGNMMKRSINI